MKDQRKSANVSRRLRRDTEAGPAGGLAVSRLDLIISGIVFAFAFLIYIQTMSRSIPYIDGGELTTDIWTLGIAHPTGYPLFSMLGYLFVHIPILPEVAARANLFAALCTSIAAGLFYLVFLRAQLVFAAAGVTDRKSKHAATGDTSKRLEQRAIFIRWGSVIAAFVLIFSSTFWDQSTSIEVYPLQLVLFALILLVWLRLYAEPARGHAFVAGLVLGLGFTNHMTTILTVPALIYLLVFSYKDHRYSLKLLPYIVYGGLLASLIYIYLPLRASQSPLMDWGNPDTIKRFIWQVTGKQFQTWMFSSFEVFQRQLGVFFTSLFREFRISLIVVVGGLVVSFLYRRRLFWWTILLIIGDISYAANYSIHDISSYFLLSYVSLALLAGVGFSGAMERFTTKKSFLPIAFGLLLLFPGFSATSNFSRVDESHDYAVEMYTRDILTSLPHNSLVLSFQWDDWVSASLYYQHVDSVRPDIIVIDKELLRRSWYAAQVHKRYPFLFPSPDPIYRAYQDNLRLFENDLPYDPNSIQHTYSEFIREIISGALRDGRHVFVGPEMEEKYLYGYNKVPYGLLYELTTDTAYVPFGIAGLDGFKAAEKIHNDYTRQILGFYTRMFLSRAQYEYDFHRLRRTLAWIDKALEVDPTLQAAQNARSRIMMELRAK